MTPTMPASSRSKRLKALWGRIKYNRWLYLFFLPALILYIVFTYYPMYGAILAFKDLNYKLGIMASPWTSMGGLKHFYDLISDSAFKQAFINTVVISLGRILFEFPIPIALALMMNEIRREKTRRLVQTVFTFPHFVSWVIMSGIIFNLFSDSGVINSIIFALGGQKGNVMTNADTFRYFLFGTNAWKEMGWGTIIYLATISGIDVSQYEAAIVDGAKRSQLAWYITLPAMKSVIGVMLILNISSLMNAGFDQVFNLYNAAVYSKADIIDTLIYRRTFVSGASFASSTAVGLFKSVINFSMLIIGNTIVKRATGKGLY
jgi:putative aldouronate transport system permease protein